MIFFFRYTILNIPPSELFTEKLLVKDTQNFVLAKMQAQENNFSCMYENMETIVGNKEGLMIKNK